jgi:hypothetical protein
VGEKEKAMIFPKGEVRHQNLLTTYTDFHALLSTLKLEGFSGTIEIEFPENKGVLFIDSGKITNAEAKKGDDSKRIVGPEAIQYLLALSNQKDGVINIYRLLPEQVAIVASNLQHEILFKGLSTEFTRLDRLLLKLKEEKHNGFIEILTKENQTIGVLFLQEGEPAEMFTTQESGPSVFGRKSITTFVENAIKEGAIFNVYRSQERSFQEETTTVEEVGDMKELIPILQEILSKVEKLVDGVSQKGKFLDAFKKSLLEKADAYPFLDPFSGEFNYQDGSILFTGEAPRGDFIKGIGECLRTAVSYLEKELPKDKILPLKLKAGIESSLEKYSEALKRLGVEAITSSIFK